MVSEGRDAIHGHKPKTEGDLHGGDVGRVRETSKLRSGGADQSGDEDGGCRQAGEGQKKRHGVSARGIMNERNNFVIRFQERLGPQPLFA
jgi:hypothetical protein